MRERAMQDAQASALGALDEDPPAAGAHLMEHRRGLTYVRPQLGNVTGRPYCPRSSPLLDPAGQRRPAAGARGPDSVPERGFALDVAILDDQRARVDGQPIRRHRAIRDLAHQYADMD